jgi:hypothetical protein
MHRLLGISAALAGLSVLIGAATAETMDVGAIARVQRTVYGVPPQGSQLVKREGDSVFYQEAIETMDRSGALIRFVDDSTLTLGEKSKVLIDNFVFDAEKAEGNALIRISVGVLRFVTGDMPKGKTIIKTPTATLILRGTDVTVQVHPDGTTDATVHDGGVDGHNDVTDDDAGLEAGQGGTFGYEGNSAFSGSEGPTGSDFGSGDATDPPEHRRSGYPESQHESESNGGPGN